MQKSFTVKNAQQLPKVYYGLHFCEGLAEYRTEGQDPQRILINESVAKKMDPSFTGRPLYVEHVESVDLRTLQKDADGYVVKSFFNQADGKHWVQFIVVSDEGHEAIRKGWTLSNAYVPKMVERKGQWHGVDYSHEVVDGEYEHLAIVSNPRYQESVVLTPDEFKAYNSRKEAELKQLSNSKDSKSNSKSKGERKMGMGLSFWKREKVENSIDVENTMVVLPNSKKEVSLANAIELADKFENMAGYACDDHMVNMGEGEDEMSVKKLKSSYMSMKKANEESEMEDCDNEADEGKDSAEKEEPEMKNKKGKKKNEADDEVIVADKKFFNQLKNAEKNARNFEQPAVNVGGIERGKERYGSGK